MDVKPINRRQYTFPCFHTSLKSQHFHIQTQFAVCTLAYAHARRYAHRKGKYIKNVKEPQANPKEVEYLLFRGGICKIVIAILDLNRTTFPQHSYNETSRDALRSLLLSPEIYKLYTITNTPITTSGRLESATKKRRGEVPKITIFPSAFSNDFRQKRTTKTQKTSTFTERFQTQSTRKSIPTSNNTAKRTKILVQSKKNTYFRTRKILIALPPHTIPNITK